MTMAISPSLLTDVRRRLGAAAICLLATFSMSGCFSFTKNDMIRINGGSLSADVLIFRHATRALGVAYDFQQGTPWQKTRFVAERLRTAVPAGSLNDFVQDRWWGATDDDQYTEIREELARTRSYSRCLTVKVKAGWGDVGYDWHTHDLYGPDGCVWGVNPLP